MTPRADLVVLRPGDEPRVDEFLRQHTASSLFLRSNLGAAGLIDRGQVYQGAWVAAQADGALQGVVCHAWNGTLLLQAPDEPAILAEFAVATSARRVHGLIGPCDQVERVRRALRLTRARAVLDEREALFSLDLAALAVPSILRDKVVECRRSAPADLDTLASWRKAYEETLFKPPHVDRGHAATMRRLHDDGWLFVLSAGGDLVAMCAYNAVVPDCVQIGGVWTPSHLRRRGYGRAVVAGALLEARAAGVTTSILFTSGQNDAAVRAYHSLGYEKIGCYGLLLFRAGQTVTASSRV